MPSLKKKLSNVFHFLKQYTVVVSVSLSEIGDEENDHEIAIITTTRNFSVDLIWLNSPNNLMKQVL